MPEVVVRVSMQDRAAGVAVDRWSDGTTGSALRGGRSTFKVGQVLVKVVYQLRWMGMK